MTRPEPSRPNAGERLAAAGALLAVAGAAAIVLAGVARNVLAVLVIAASLLLFVGSGWYAISRRGARRLAAGLVMVCLLAVFAVTLALADTSIIRGITAAALSVVSVTAARYALRRTPKALGSAADRFPAAPASRASRADHEPEVRRRESAAIPAGRGVPCARNRACCPSAR